MVVDDLKMLDLAPELRVSTNDLNTAEKVSISDAEALEVKF